MLTLAECFSSWTKRTETLSLLVVCTVFDPFDPQQACYPYGIGISLASLITATVPSTFSCADMRTMLTSMSMQRMQYHQSLEDC